MEELATKTSEHTTDNDVPTAHQRKVQAAQKAAELARQREEGERQELHNRIRLQAEEEGYKAGFEQGHKEGMEKGLTEAAEQAHLALQEQIKQTVTP